MLFMVLTSDQKDSFEATQTSTLCDGVTIFGTPDVGAAMKVASGNGGPKLNTVTVDVSVNVDGTEAGLAPDFYYFAVRECPCTINCTNALHLDGNNYLPHNITNKTNPAVCEASITLLNADGNHLSSDELLMPETTRVLLVAWIIGIGLWLLNWGCYFRTSNRLHDLLTVGPLAKLGCAICEFYDIRNQQTTGVVASPLADGTMCLNMLSSAWFFFICLLGVHGFCIMTTDLEEGRMLMIGLPFLFFVSSAASEWVHEYFLALVIILACIMVWNILRGSGMQLYYLRVRHMEIVAVLDRHGQADNEAYVDAITEPLLSKRFLLSALRVAFVGYALIWAFLGIIKVYLEKTRWLEHLLLDLLWIVTWWFLMWAFRLRNMSRFASSAPPVEPQEGEGAADDPDALCSSVSVPGGQVAFLGVPVSTDQFAEYIRKVKVKSSLHGGRMVEEDDDT
jgi:hypothetical protein